MINLECSLVIEAAEEPNFFRFYAPDLEGCTGVGNSFADCPYSARWGTDEHVALLRERGLPVPSAVDHPRVAIENTESTSRVAS